MEVTHRVQSTNHKGIISASFFLASFIVVLGMNMNKDPIYFVAGGLVMLVVVPMISNLHSAIDGYFLSVSIVVPILYLPYSLFTYLRLDDLMFGLVGLFWLIDKKHRRQDTLDRLKKENLFWPILLFNLSVLFSIFPMFYFSDVSLLQLGNFFWWSMRHFQAMAIFLMAYSLGVDRAFLARTSRLIFFAGSVLAIVAFLQFFHFVPVYNYGGFHITMDLSGNSITSLLSFHPTHLGLYMVITLFLSLDSYRIYRRKLLIIVGCVLFSLTLVITMSRASWVAFAVALILYIAQRFYTIKGLSLILILAGVSVLVLPLGLADPVLSRLGLHQTREAQSAIGSAEWRLKNNRRVVSLITEEPELALIGVGFANWRYEINRKLGYNSSSAHNNFLQALLELGILGFLSFLWFWFSLIARLSKRTKEGMPEALPLQVCLLGFLASCAFQETLFPVWATENFLPLVLLLCGLWLGTKQEPDPGPLLKLSRYGQ